MKFKRHPSIYIYIYISFQFVNIDFRKIGLNIILFYKHEFINLVTTDMLSNSKPYHFISYVEKNKKYPDIFSFTTQLV